MEHKEWRYLVTKTNVQHIVPINSQALKLLKELQLLTGDGNRLFPSPKDPNNKFISDGTIRSAYISLGIDTSDEHTEHGWRATARTILEEVVGFPPLPLELQLSHKDKKDRLKGAYSRVQYLALRRQIMQTCAIYNIVSGNKTLHTVIFFTESESFTSIDFIIQRIYCLRS